MDFSEPFDLWPHQRKGLEDLYPLLLPGSSTCVTSPTGGGKTELIFELLKLGLPSILYTHRKMLLAQTAQRLYATGMPFGVRAAGYREDLSQPIQLASIQTDDSRVLKKGKWLLHDAQLVIIDEAHTVKSDTACEIVERYRKRDAYIVGFTATPLDIGHLYDNLGVAGTNSELRACGALVPAKHFAPDEPDVKGLKRVKTGEYSYGDIVKVIMTHTIFGRVVEHWRRVNPEGKASILFAPGVKESLWFAEQLTKEGIVAAHMDGNDVWLMGKFYKSDQEARDAVKTMSESGDIKIVCNRFVMREGINWPHLYCGIFATVFGALTSYIQSGGRILRAHPSMDHVVILDHGGNWHRHGSLNMDRLWALDATDYMMTENREARLRKKEELEPIQCPKCNYVRLAGPKCMNCGFEHHDRSRMVVQQDGRLKEVKGEIYKPRRIDRRSGAEKRWEKCWHRARRADMTVNQAIGLYAMENKWCYPDTSLPLMPIDGMDFFRKVKDIPRERLIQQ